MGVCTQRHPILIALILEFTLALEGVLHKEVTASIINLSETCIEQII